MKNRYVIAAAFTVLVVTIIFLIGYFIWEQNRLYAVDIVFETADGKVELSIYEQAGTTDDIAEFDSSQSPIATIGTSDTVQLKNGSYVAVSKQTGDFVPIRTAFTVEGERAAITIAPRLTSKKLAELEAIETAAITQAVNEQLKGVDSYSLDKPRLYLDSEWAGVVLKPKGKLAQSQDRRDVLRVVLKKENSSWLVVTDPAIVLGSPEYPDVPFEVLNDINKDQAQPTPQDR